MCVAVGLVRVRSAAEPASSRAEEKYGEQQKSEIESIRDEWDMSTDIENRAPGRRRSAGVGVGRLVRRLERERRAWSQADEREIPTAQAWRAGVAEGIRLAQVAIRKGV